MKMVRAIVRPEKVDSIVEGLEEAGHFSLTKLNVFGRGKQKGITLGDVHYDELPKVMVLMVVDDESVEEVIKIISFKSYTGHFGDGKVFVSPVEEAITIRTGARGL
ncbi:MAG: nitrogen regulatory protein [Paenibacillaceae bacterium]|jgi:nitrogen regulatory protein PII 1|nr:nitrogen regulatory protein [Paenibacillaceae bacterium]